MILDTQFEEEVNGHVVGGFVSVLELRYEGRRQGPRLYGSIQEAREQAEAYIAELKREFGHAFREIFPNSISWSLVTLEAGE